MTDESDQCYNERRAREELALAASTADPAIAAIHAELAERYAARLASSQEEVASDD